MLSRMAPRTVPHSMDIGVDARVLAATAGAAIVCGLIVGVVPAWRSLRSTDLRSARGVSRTSAMSRTLVTAAIALSVLLVVAAGLMARTFAALNPTALGFTPQGRVAAQLNLPAEGLAHGPSAAAISALMNDVRGTAGIRAAAISTYQPLRGYPSSARVRIDGLGSANGTDDVIDAWAGAMESGFLTTLGASFAAGRDFDEHDTADAPPAAIVNDAFVRRVLGGDAAGAIGRTLDVTWDDNTRAVRRIVGVVRTMRTGGYDTDARAEIFAPLTQSQLPSYLYVVADTALPPAAVKAALLGAARRQFARPVVDPVDAMAGLVDTAFARPRFAVWLFGVFAGVAALLAAGGLATAIAWSVAQRRREIAIRMALGADRAATMSLVLRQALVMTLAGVAAGTAASAAGTRLLGDWLYGVSATDPITFGAAVLAMAAIASIAAYGPARRASRVDAAGALRAE